eukprot:COSAG06_NODE_2880_length_6138_cov_2.667826_2_plen_120_part_00
MGSDQQTSCTAVLNLSLGLSLSTHASHPFRICGELSTAIWLRCFVCVFNGLNCFVQLSVPHWLFVTSASSAAFTCNVRRPQRPTKNGPFFEFSLCLSRACLGKPNLNHHCSAWKFEVKR